MKIIVFDPPYSRYFNDLALTIDNLIDGGPTEKECVCVNYADAIYLPVFRLRKLDSIPVSSDDLKQYEFVNRIRSLSNIQGGGIPEELCVANISVYKWLEKYIANNESAIFLLYNDLRWNHAFAIDILRKKGCAYFVFERGAFRGTSTTMDRQGVNANAYFTKAPLKYFSSEEASGLNSVFFKSRTERSPNTRFASFIIIKFILSFLEDHNVKLVRRNGKNKGFIYYFYLYLKKVVRKNVINEDEDFGRFIFVPLQLSNDTQTLINSNFGNTQEFIDYVISQFETSDLNSSHQLVFKVHPMDTEKYFFSDSVMISNLPTEKLLNECDGCLTINSTVGFEGLNKAPVFCFGKSFYTEHGLVKKLDKGMPFYLDITSKIDASNYYLNVMSSYQVPGSIFNYDGDDLIYAAKRILMEYSESKEGK